MNKGEWASESSVTAIDFPVRIGEHAIGAINLVLQKNVVSDREIATRYVPSLRAWQRRSPGARRACRANRNEL
jgi:IclR family mhp operon transcriptional activator